MGRLILFDIDGTLLWTNGAGREATRLAMLEVFGTEAGLNQHVFGGKTDWYTLVELLGAFGYTPDDVARLLPTYHVAMTRNLRNIIGNYNVQACPGALALVEVLRRRDDVLLGIVTGNVKDAAAVKLRAAGYDPAWFPVGAYGHEAFERDHLPPIALMRAMEHYRQSIQAQDVIVIGDTPADVACARALGALAVAVNTGFGGRENLAACHPDHLIDDLSGFLAILDS
jgi:phosphoglycolate phosphatase